MISAKTAILAGAVVVGLAGFTAYASGTFCATETVQAQPAQAIFVSGGDKSCCAEDKTTTTAQNAVFTPKVQTAALEGGACPYDAKQQATLTANTKACDAQATTTTAAMVEGGKSCDTKTTTAALTNASKACGDKATMTTAEMVESGQSCDAKTTATTAALTNAGQACGDKAAVTTASLASNGQSCCATESKGVKTTTSKTTLAGVVPVAKTAN